MGFKMKYPIETNYLPLVEVGRRPGIPLGKVRFIVAHDTGNDGSTAPGNIGYYADTPHIEASAHTFVDHEHIIECIPAATGTPEKAWHVIYNVTADNEVYGDDANDVAIGVELCYFYQKPSSLSPEERKRRSLEAYKRYVWYIAYLCYTFNLDPATDITGHYKLDPKRKTDPINAFSKMGITWEKFINDVQWEYNDCTKPGVVEEEDDETMKLPGSYQVPMLITALETLGKEGIINSAPMWIDKVKSGQMTNSELAWLSLIVTTKLLVLNKGGTPS
ncbi:N-acetylmuramoyl-L-alanine amidase [Brevibacillus sp. SYP-B805]|uniref:peptidoglycan recognition protein family protein n=1 Tax=Brevibacillus sp. SYP-B805 TaxID=1578199 RepID=UPI0013EBF569|nr:peptidoglycan recognition family protein [Brevibacillus sp. SYP-B805]NGQ95308.1 N-acetylmuramoyl-L-alanine amidase [Brevibacillus sp. SYP-B805]